MNDSRDPRLNLTPPVTRRVLKRRDYQTNCRLEFIDPAWAMLPKFAPARTVNITENGVRVEIIGFARKRHEHLCEILKEQGAVGVRVCLARTGSVLALPGEIVWAHFEQEEGEFGTSSLGVLLALLDPPIQEQLRALVRDLSTPPPGT